MYHGPCNENEKIPNFNLRDFSAIKVNLFPSPQFITLEDIMVEISVQNTRHNTHLPFLPVEIISSGYKEEKGIGSDTQRERGRVHR